jgi:hypothetical protein
MVHASQINSIQSQKDFAFHKISKSEKSPTGNTKDLIKALQEGSLFKVRGQAGFDFPNFPETNKKFRVLYMELNHDFQDVQAILNGFLALGQPQGVILEFDKTQNNYSLKYYLQDAPSVMNYLDKLTLFINEEVRFKKILKRILENNKRTKIEERLLINELIA